MKRDQSSLLDILDNARLVQEFVDGFDKPGLGRDKKTLYAVIRCIEIIGEATKRISDDFKAAHPEIAWKQMAGMRDAVIHNYDQVSLNQVWNVVQNDIPVLIAQIEPLIPPEEQS